MCDICGILYVGYMWHIAAYWLPFIQGGRTTLQYHQHNSSPGVYLMAIFIILSKVHLNCHRHRNICTMWNWSLEEALEFGILSKKLDLWNLLCRSLTFLVKRNDESDDDDSSGWLIVCIKSKMTSCSKFPYWVIGHVSAFFQLS